MRHQSGNMMHIAAAGVVMMYNLSQTQPISPPASLPLKGAGMQPKDGDGSDDCIVILDKEDVVHK
eukprot:3425593-Karenia_brevis.AAC.1